MVRYSLSNYGYRSYDHTKDIIDPTEVDVTGCGKDDEDFEMKFSRDGLRGVIVEESVPQGFIGEAFDLLRELYEQYGQYAVCSLNIYHRDAIDPSIYTLVKSFDIDFGTIKVYDNYVEIEVENTGLNTFIKSAGRTKFDIPVSDIKDELPWLYDRLVMRANGSWIMPENYIAKYNQFIDGNNYITGCPFLKRQDFKTPPDAVPHEVTDAQGQFGGGFGYDDFNDDMRGRSNQAGAVYNSMPYFFRAAADVEVTVSMKFKFNVSPLSPAPDGALFNQIILCFYKNFGDTGTIIKIYNNVASVSEDIEDDIVLSLKAGDALSLGFNLTLNTVYGAQVTFTDFEYFRMYYDAKGAARYVDVIEPEVLLSTLLSKMTDGRYTDASIEWRAGMSHTPMLCAAESLRGFDAAAVHTSFNDFAEWLRVKGYEYILDAGGITFKPREAIYPVDVIAELGEGEVSDFVREASGEYAYTSVKIGYDKYEYDDEYNGRREVNGTFEYLTGLLRQDENVLELISPYRADPIGIEMLCWETPENGKGEESTRSDNDMFEVALLPDRSLTVWYTYILSVLQSGELTLFNAPLCPDALVAANAQLLGVITDMLYFSSTTSARDAVRVSHSGTEPILVNIPIDRDKKIFNPELYNFAAGSHVLLPAGIEANGLVKITYKGREYEGYIMEGSRNLARGTEADFTLIAK
jgi:hypothetical protein